MTSVMTLTFFSVGLTLKSFSGVHSTIIPNFILLTKIAQLFHQGPPLKPQVSIQPLVQVMFWRKAISWSNDDKNLYCLESTLDVYELIISIAVCLFRIYCSK